MCGAFAAGYNIGTTWIFVAPGVVVFGIVVILVVGRARRSGRKGATSSARTEMTWDKNGETPAAADPGIEAPNRCADGMEWEDIEAANSSSA